MNRLLKIAPPPLLFLFLIFNGFFIAYSLQRHYAFETGGFDLGNYDQALWNTLNGEPLLMTTMEGVRSRWELHFELTLLLLTPLYALWPRAETLLILQNLIVALGAAPIFFLARRRLRSDAAGLVFATVYLLFPALQAPLAFDFHAVSLAATFLAFALWFLNIRRYGLVLVMTLLAMGCKENIPLVVMMMGGYSFFVQRSRLWGAVIATTALLWFGLANFIIIPAVSPSGDNIHLDRYSQWGDGMSGVMLNLLRDPWSVLLFIFSGDRLFYWIRVTLPVVFTALLDPLTLLMAAPIMVINTLSAYPPNYQLDRFHYSVVIVPFVVVASINGLARLNEFVGPKLRHIRPAVFQNLTLAMILLVTMVYQLQFGHTPVGRLNFAWPSPTPHHTIVQRALAQVPSQAVVAAQNNLAPHLTQRRWIYILPKMEQQGHVAEYVLFDLKSSLDPYRYIEAYCAHLDNLLTDPKYGLTFAEDGVLVFRRGSPDAATFESMFPCQDISP